MWEGYAVLGRVHVIWTQTHESAPPSKQVLQQYMQYTPHVFGVHTLIMELCM